MSQASAQEVAQPESLPDTALVQALIDSSFEYSYSDPDLAITYAERALTLSREINYRKGIAGALDELGYAYNTKGNFAKAIDHFEKGIEVSRAVGDSLELVSILNNLGNTYKTQNEYERALEYYFESLALCEQMELERGVSVTLGNIGLCYFELKNHDQALEYYQKALEINQRLGNKASLAINYNNIGLLHGDEGRFEEALQYHQKALELRRELGYTMEIANSLNNIGRLYMQQKQHKPAVSYLKQAFLINEDRDPELTSIIHENLAKTYIAAAQYDSALVHAEQTLELSEDFGTKLGMKVGYELLAKIHKELGNYRKAFENQQKLTAVKDSILNEEKSRQINELQTKYETAQKEKEIALLEKEKQREALLRNAFLAGLILIGIIGLLVYNRQRLKIKKNRTELENRRLKEQKMEQDLEFKNKQLTTHTLHLVQKNEAMRELKEKITDIRQQENGNINKALQKLRNLVDYSFSLDDDWEQFRLYFEEVHTGFFDVLKEEYPDLTPNELRLAALAKLNLSIKETATIMGITPASVKTARYRLRKKLDMETEENLTEFLMEVEDRGISNTSV
ncbi:tetratricopeptide repeat protein [Aliifodinibius sp. S!AR15-10]|nr:tetratricopeptide repeat protein [Aliifodinibius sp. S!AR15-10]